jgi:hypothetical protein
LHKGDLSSTEIRASLLPPKCQPAPELRARTERATQFVAGARPSIAQLPLATRYVAFRKWTIGPKRRPRSGPCYPGPGCKAFLLRHLCDEF